MRPLIYLTLAAGLASSPALGAPPLFTTLDSNGNGAISQAEFLVLRQEMFLRMDANQNGTLTQAEIEAARAAMPQDRKIRRAPPFEALDANKDGVLTMAEYTAQTRGFDYADRNNDGQLSLKEFNRIASFLQAARP